MVRYSIVISNVGTKKALYCLLESIYKQEDIIEEEYEIIVVDAHYNEEIDTYIRENSNRFAMKYVYISGCTLPINNMKLRNLGWQTATGEWIIFIDSNLILDSNYLKEVSRSYRAGQNHITLGMMLYQTEDYPLEQSEYVDKIIKLARKRREKSLEQRHVAFEVLSYNLGVYNRRWLFVNVSNLSIPRDLLVKYEGFEVWRETCEGLEDLALAYRMSLENIKIILNHKMEVVKQLDENKNVTEKVTRVKLEDFMDKYPKAFEGIVQGRELEIFELNHLIEKRLGILKDKQMLKAYKLNQVAVKKEKIEFKDAQSLDEIKSEINNKSYQKEFIIKDCVENTNLDLWLQLQDFNGPSPQYFPDSKHVGLKVSIKDAQKYEKNKRLDMHNMEAIKEILNNNLVAIASKKLAIGSDIIAQKNLLKVRIKKLNMLVTKYCNIRCQMCDYVERSKDEKEITLDMLKRIFSEAREMGLEQVEFSGGEPMARKDIYELLSYVRDLGVKQTIMMTNGTLIGEKEAKKLVASGLKRCVISLEGKETLNDSIRGKGVFNKVLQAVKYLKAAQIESVRIGITITRKNYKDIYDLVSFLFEEVGVDSISFNPFSEGFMLEEHLNKSKDDFAINTEEMIEELEGELKRLLSTARVKGWDIPSEEYLSKIPDYFRKKKMTPKVGCIAPITSCCITNEGDVFTCWGESVYIGNMRNSTLKEITSSMKYQKLCREAINRECRGCLSACYEQVHYR